MIMVVRLRSILRSFAHAGLICATLFGGSTWASSQTTDSSSEQAQEAQPFSDNSPSADQSANNPQRQHSPQSVVCGLTHLGRCLKDVAQDQAGIWTSPLRIKSSDALWLVPFAGATGVALHYDAQAQQELGIDKGRIDTSNIISGFGSP